MLILVCNAGSTSLKFKLFDLPAEDILVEARIERVGTPNKGIYSYHDYKTGWQSKAADVDVPSYSEGINMFLRDLTGSNGMLKTVEEIKAIGFKTVVATNFLGIHELTPEVLVAMEKRLDISPVHNKCYLEAIRKFKEILPNQKMIGVFETSFHTTIPLHARLYGVPYEWYEQDGIQRLGYHGASHGYIAHRVEQLSGKNPKIISCHLGGSSSICAINNGKSIETSFGFSPQSGLPHANRVGDLDVYALVYQLNKGVAMEKILDDLSKNGGLYGISGVSNDMREIEDAAAKGNERAQLAIDFLCHEIKKYVGAYNASLEGLEYLVFTAGIGEHSKQVRSKVCAGLKHLGIELDPEANRSGADERRISSDASKVQVWIIPTNEEVGIAVRIYQQMN